jgi:transcriptional regulator with XRE-family HTH domain
MTLSSYLQSRNLTQDSFARKTGLSHSYLNQLVNKKRRASPEIAKRIEAATDGEVTAASLLGVTDRGGSAQRLPDGRWVLRPDENGDVLVPARLLEEFGAGAGEPLGAHRSEDGVRMEFIHRNVRRAQAEFTEGLPEGHNIVDEFIAEKRAEAARE